MFSLPQNMEIMNFIFQRLLCSSPYVGQELICRRSIRSGPFWSHLFIRGTFFDLNKIMQVIRLKLFLYECFGCSLAQSYYVKSLLLCIVHYIYYMHFARYLLQKRSLTYLWEDNDNQSNIQGLRLTGTNLL